MKIEELRRRFEAESVEERSPTAPTPKPEPPLAWDILGGIPVLWRRSKGLLEAPGIPLSLQRRIRRSACEWGAYGQFLSEQDGFSIVNVSYENDIFSGATLYDVDVEIGYEKHKYHFRVDFVELDSFDAEVLLRGLPGARRGS